MGVSAGDGFHGAPVVHEGRVYAANFGGEVVAADEDSGELLWTFNVGAPVVGSMSAAGARHSWAIPTEFFTRSTRCRA